MINKGRDMIFRRLSATLALLLLPASLLADAPMMPEPVPAWPLTGTDADVQVMPDSARYRRASDGNIKIVSKIGADLTVENNITVGPADSFSGGANLTMPYPAATGFYPYENQAEMPFMHSEMLEDDGAAVLSVSKTNRKRVLDKRGYGWTDNSRNAELTDIAVDGNTEEPDKAVKDQVRSWVVASGQTLRDVLQAWCDREGWDLIWNTSREYPIAASAVFKGRFLDVSSALVRNFSRAAPIPYAKFYKGNRVLVISTTEDE
ncbi:MAG: toxin co-regulated pilus biosynthesis Q family protein [Rickettsiales bacterium]|jgi:hypothetical protein|nr:toxin co-regulated pilus biosynthesis Q family protein [Rickettsiales bacterium]